MGPEKLKELLSGWSGSASLATRLAFIRGAGSLGELTADALADAESLDQDTESRRKRHEELMEWLMALGQVGTSLLVKILFV
jgi:hypothetical protein